MSLPLAESFLTVQGEGPRAGRLSHFLRFGGCNLSCGYAGGWQCDSGYTWDSRKYTLRDEITLTKPLEIADMVESDCDEVVLTGGEPLMNQKNPDWASLLRLLSSRRKFVSVETNGTIAPGESTQTFVQHFSISPKLSNTKHKTGQSPALANWPLLLRTNFAVLKFVCSTADDVREAAAFADDHGWPRWRVWVQPEGIDEATLAIHFKAIAEEAIAQRINLGHRLHILAFGNTRGT